LLVQGFRKTDPERWEFTNEYFQKGRRDLLGSIVRRKPAGAAKSEHHDLDDDLGADDRTASLPSMSPRQFPMPSPRDHQFPPGMLPPLDHYQAGGMPRRGSFSGAVADALQSPRDALAAAHGGSGATHDPHQQSAMAAQQASLLSPRGFSGFHRPSAEAATSHGMSDPTHGARHFSSPGDVDMLSGGRKPGSAGGASSAFAAPAGQAMAPASAGQQQAGGGNGGGLTQSHGSGGLEGIQRFTRLVDNVMGGSGSSHTTNDHTASNNNNNRSPVVPGSHGASHLSNGSAPPPPQPPMQQQQQQQFQQPQPQPQRSEDSHSRQQTTTHSAERTSGSAGQPGGSTGSPEGDYGQADMEDATVKKRKYRRSTERRRPMDHQSGAAMCCMRVTASTNRRACHNCACGPGSSLMFVAELALMQHLGKSQRACSGAPEVAPALCAKKVATAAPRRGPAPAWRGRWRRRTMR